MKTLRTFLIEGDVIRHKFATKLSQKKGITKPRGPWKEDSIYHKYNLVLRMKDGDETTHHHDGVEVHHKNGSTTFIKHGHELINPDLTYDGNSPYISHKTKPNKTQKNNVVGLRDR